MLQIKNIAVKNAKELVDKARNVADSFGFSHMEKHLENFERKKLSAPPKLLHAHKREQIFAPHMRTLASHELHKHKGHMLCYDISLGNKNSNDNFSLHVVGAEGPIAEATLIAAAHTLLQDVGISGSVVHVNSLGIGDSFTRYMRDLTKYLKKISNDVPLQVRTDMQVSPIKAYARLTLLNKELVESGPRSIDYLNDEGRSHLWGVLEYLEGANIPYVIDSTIIGSGDYFEHTLFELQDEHGETLAYGGRYSSLGRKSYKRHIPSVGVIFEFDEHIPKLTTSKKAKEPAFFFAQLGLGAKKLGLRVLSELHKAGVKVAHAITEDSLSKQMEIPFSKSAPYTIIIGHKEALEDSVVVRESATMRQTTLSMAELPDYLKSLGV